MVHVLRFHVSILFVTLLAFLSPNSICHGRMYMDGTYTIANMQKTFFNSVRQLFVSQFSTVMAPDPWLILVLEVGTDKNKWLGFIGSRDARG